MSKKEKMGKCIMCGKETTKDDVVDCNHDICSPTCCNHYICGPKCFNDHMLEMWKKGMGYE